MVNYKCKSNQYELIEILENVAIIYKFGKERNDVFDAIHIKKEGIYTGYILKKVNRRKYNNKLFRRFRKKSCFNLFEEFIECGFIPKKNIKNIEGSTKRKVFRKK